MKYLKPKQAKRPIPMQKVLKVKNHQEDKKDSRFSDTQLSENTRNSKRHTTQAWWCILLFPGLGNRGRWISEVVWPTEQIPGQSWAHSRFCLRKAKETHKRHKVTNEKEKSITFNSLWLCAHATQHLLQVH